MAGYSSADSLQIVNIDLAVERQRILREKSQEIFSALSGKSKVKKNLVYTVNQTSAELDQVVRTNPQADALFTAFNYDIHVSEEFKESHLVDSALDASLISAAERYPHLGEYLNLVEREYFKHRRLILVGDIHEKIGQALKSNLPVEVTCYSDGERSQVAPPRTITDFAHVLEHQAGAPPTSEHIIVSAIHTLIIGGVSFHGVVNMPERNNRFVLEDKTLLDTIRKIYTMQGIKEVMVREALAEEQLTFVRGKKVLLVLENDLENVISDRLVFDKMQKIFRFHSLDEALANLANGKSQNLLEYFENEGYDPVFKIFTQEQRDALLVTLLGERLAAVLLEEVRAQKGNLNLLEEKEVRKILNGLSEPVLEHVLEGLQSQSYEKFLSLVPLKIRENLMQTFLSDPTLVKGAWNAIGEAERKEILQAQANPVLAFLFLVDTPLFQSRFEGLKFEFDSNYHSANLANLGQEEQQATLKLIEGGLRRAKLPPGLVAEKLNGEEQERIMADYVLRDPGDFFSRLTPLVRKQLWITVGNRFKDRIASSLHHLDKIAIMEGNREASLALLFQAPLFMEFLKSPKNLRAAGVLFLILKRNNKVESKTALLRKVLFDPEWQGNRQRHLAAFFSDPANQAVAEKMSEFLEDDFDFKFDSLICTRADHEKLKDQEPLRDAGVILVDDLVDASLFNLFDKGGFSKEEYDSFSEKVEGEIARLREKISEKESEDPVGAYLLESMQILHEMTNQAVQGQLDAEAIEKLDERQAIRERMIKTMHAHLEKVRDFLAKAGEQKFQLLGKLDKVKNMMAGQSDAYQKAYKIALEAKEALQKLTKTRNRLMVERKKVALTQKELSLQFFFLIQPLIMTRVRRRLAFLNVLLRPFGLFRKEVESRAKRIIFKFSDKEIENILRYKIVFCSRNEVLMQFILTCLRIDNLQDSLFVLSTLESLPSDRIDILFHGPDYTAEDFQGRVPRKRIVPFADQPFMEQLAENEKSKAHTKSALGKSEQEMARIRPQLEQEGRKALGQQAKLKKVEGAGAALQIQLDFLVADLEKQKEREHHYQGELSLLESHLTEVDEKFDFIKETLDHLGAEKGGGAISLLDSGKESLGEKLQGELMAMNKELARMMVIKGVKDVGGRISQDTQNGILARMEQMETLTGVQLPLQKLVVADDGSNNARNLKRVFIQAASAYFKLKEGSLEDISISRLESQAETPNGEPYPFVALIADGGDTEFEDVKRVVKKVRNQMPETYQMVLLPFGEIRSQEPTSPLVKNVTTIKNNSCLVNTAIADYTQPASLVRLLGQKAPLRSL